MRQFPGFRFILATTAALPLILSAPAAAQKVTGRPSLLNSFRLGSGGSALCQVQARATDPAMKGMFDRAYAIVCRDAATPVGRVYALRNGAADPVARLAALRGARVQCSASGDAAIDDLASARLARCNQPPGMVDYNVYTYRQGRTSYVAEGLAGYDGALRLALRTIVADRFIPGEIEVATTGGGDPAAFARVQAGSLDIDQALAEGYRRNNSGSYAEAAEFFDTLLQRAESGGAINQRQLGEYVVNRALQKSNLGDFAEADALFAQADRISTADPVQLRLRRNFRALHLLNQRLLPEALAMLDRPLAAVEGAMPKAGASEIDAAAAAGLNSGVPLNRRLGATESIALTQSEKAAILDAQALQLRGTTLRLQGNLPAARLALETALGQLTAVREGRVTSITRLRAQTMAELSAVAEAGKDYPRAETLLRDAVVLLQSEYPRSAALNASKARLAAFLGRRGQDDAALTLYKEVVGAMTASGGATGFENLLAPYFALLARQIPSKPALVDDFFAASETLVRPGVADTQAVLARELSGGSDDASRLFRQSVNLTRDIERSRVEYARLAALPAPGAEEQARLAALTTTLASLESDQVATQARLSQYPRYRAISTQGMTLAELRKALRPGEAYYKLAEIGDAVYAIFVTADDATAFRTGIGAKALERKVDALRDTISIVENDQPVTYPFDVKQARELYVALMQPIEGRLGPVKNLMFEPDGAMLRLPANLLVMEQAGVDAYLKRTADPKGDAFDFTGIHWLGRDIDVSTSLSARAFRDVRNAAPSSAKKEYLGLGQNQPVSPLVKLASSRSVSGKGGLDCDWPLEAWNRPIAATELKTAQSIIGANEADVVTGPQFTDTGLLARKDLDQFRILHFATHGLVTAPRPECPARPALLTSFGGARSDGLLTFREIYDLRLDADIVILSACDTAGKATVAATREAGVTVGGGDALDGLVRAFIGAGGRSVLASHWPLPDDYGATEKLISGLFNAKPGTSIAEAIRAGQDMLMARPETSHPYYWAGFAIVGDGTQPVLKQPVLAQR